MIIWMVGEYNSIGQIIPRMLTTILAYLAQCFTSEAVETKHQILNASVKVLLSAKEEDLLTFRRLLNYVLELAKCDLNYDVRDRARIMEKLLLIQLGSDSLEEKINSLPQDKDRLHILAECVFEEQIKLPSLEPINYRFCLPGSLSQIVLHAAPGYEPLPKPGSLQLHFKNLSQYSDLACAMNASREEASCSDSNRADDPDAASESLDEESTSGYSSQYSNADSSGSDGSDDRVSEGDDNGDPLIQLSDNGDSRRHNGSDKLELMSKRALESWLDEQPGSSNLTASEQGQVRRSSARISIADIGGRVKPKIYMLLDPANGNGLRVDSFSSDISSISPQLVCVEVSFKNCSSEPMSKVMLVDEESENGLGSASPVLATAESSSISHDDVPTLVPMEEITSLEAGQTTKKMLQVRFHHHLLPLKLALWCKGKKLPVKLWPDIGYFVRPLPMDVFAFADKESHLPGMFECMRRCTFTDHIGELTNDIGGGTLVKDMFLVVCKSLAVKMLSNANLFLVSVDLPVGANLDDASGLCLRFSSEVLRNSLPCLITISADGKCFEPLNVSVKVNCEETVFGLNLLNRVVGFLAEPSLTH
ncbi:AP3-complex subunit beta-A-like [Malania oleifera]|uniref:AP3-complex subunit beta-A-like n=1 Tax=Malania oleifera TaxID=397392 RepID=UPI0025AEA312|nr:AP3-complex subunit beta-A-like [Malania oleifera]